MELIGWDWGHCLFQNIPGDELRPLQMPSVFKGGLEPWQMDSFSEQLRIQLTKGRTLCELFCKRVCGQTFRALQRRWVICELEALWIWNGSWIKKHLLCEFGSSFLGRQQLSLRLRMYLRGMRCGGWGVKENWMTWVESLTFQFLETSRLRGERPPQCWVVVFFYYIVEYMDAVGLKKNSFLM